MLIGIDDRQRRGYLVSAFERARLDVTNAESVERAIAELQRLLSRNLPARGLYKEFYIELTMVVRRYIERTHGIRAPEQTTEEFLVAVSKDPRFAPAVITKLRAFLQAADLVKYAAYRPDRPAIDQSLATARTYVETDADERAAKSEH